MPQKVLIKRLFKWSATSREKTYKTVYIMPQKMRRSEHRKLSRCLLAGIQYPQPSHHAPRVSRIDCIA